MVINMTATEFANLCKRELHGGYLFYGVEEYMKNAAFALAEKSLLGETSDPDMDIVRISCADAPDDWFDSLRAASESYGFFSGKKIIEVRYLTKQLADREEELNGFLESLKDNDDAVVIISLSDDFDVGSAKNPSASFKKLSKHTNVVSFEKQTPAKLNAWIIKRFTREGLICDAECSGAILKYCSCDMFALASECEKLICYMKASGIQRLNNDIIYSVASALGDEGNFDFSNAVTNGNYIRALELFKAMERRKERPEIIFSEIASAVSNMYSVRVLADAGYLKGDISRELSLHEYRVGLYMTASAEIGSKGLAQLVEKCHDADLKIKSTPLNSYSVLQNLIFEVCRR